MLTIIGCGNPNRGDDGVGVVVAQRIAARLARHPVRGVRAFDCGTAGMEVMFAARGSDALVIVDASKTGAPPGAIHEVPGEALEKVPEPSYTLHDFRWDHALFAGRKIFGDAFPKDVTVWLVEAESVDYGVGLGARVAAAAEIVHAKILARIAEHAAAHASIAEGPLPEVIVKRGVAQIPKEIADAHFEGRSAIVPMLQGETLSLAPVDEYAGGLLLKIRNARGDRAVDLSEALRAHGWDTDGEIACRAAWDVERAALTLSPLREAT